MMYPPKKRAYSPENKKTKDLSNLMNINSKFAGSGGSNFLSHLRSLIVGTKKTIIRTQAAIFKHFQNINVF